ncbi:MAG: hypothetical protein ACO3NK_11170 [Prochlorotrichaceae cyanobacterium]|jgi:hypothetical protein
MSTAIIQAIRVEEGIFWFDLEETIVSSIRETSAHQSRHSPTLVLGVPRYLRRWLRKASIFDITAETTRSSGLQVPRFAPPSPPKWQSGLTFISRYRVPQGQGTGEEDWVCVLETIVSLDGDVLNKVQKELLDSEQAADISAAHFWLIDQLLLALQQDTDLLLNTITWVALGVPISLGALSMWNNGALEVKDAIAPFIGTGFSSLAYSFRDRWKPWLHTHLSRWGWKILQKQLGFS